jgi:hypothetical protein
MKDIYSFRIDEIIHDLKYITMGIKTSEQKLVIIMLKQPIKQGPCKSPANIGFRNSMFKHGIMKQVMVASGHTIDYRTHAGLTQAGRIPLDAGRNLMLGTKFLTPSLSMQHCGDKLGGCLVFCHCLGV